MNRYPKSRTLRSGAREGVHEVLDYFAVGNLRRIFLKRLISACGSSLGMGNFDGAMNRTGERRLIHALALAIPQITALDIGANQGEWTGELLRSSSTATSIAIEPGRGAFALLEGKLRGTPGFHAFRTAISSVEGEATLFGTDLNYEHASLIPNVLSKTTFADGKRVMDSELVPTRTIISVLTQAADDGIIASFAQVNVLKVDTEGYDLEVLKQAFETGDLTGLLAVQFEFNMHALVQGQTIDDFAELFGMDYALYRLAPRLLISRNEFHSSMANYFGFSNWLAIHRSIESRVVREYRHPSK